MFRVPRVPKCVVSAGPTLMPLAVPKQLAGLIPRGVGNREIAAQDIMSPRRSWILGNFHRPQPSSDQKDCVRLGFNQTQEPWFLLVY